MTTTNLLNRAAAVLYQLDGVKSQREYAVLNRERMKVREEIESALASGGFDGDAREELRGALFMVTTTWLAILPRIAREVRTR